MNTKMHSFRSKLVKNENGVIGQYFEQKHGENIMRFFGSEETIDMGQRKVFYGVSEIPAGVEMIDDNLVYEDTYTGMVSTGRFVE